MQVAADHDDAVADAAVDVEAAADDDRGVGHFFVALDADVLAEGDARAGQPIGGGVGGLREGVSLNEQTDGSDHQDTVRNALRIGTSPPLRDD